MSRKIKMPADVLSERVALKAAEWFFLLKSGEAADADITACTRWRAANPEHERAWERAERVAHKLNIVPPSLAMPTLNRPVNVTRRNAIKAFALLITATPVGWMAWRSQLVQQQLADHHTRTGERRAIVLADGTRIELNTATAIDVLFDGEQRLVRLRSGEILIDTAPDKVAADHPSYRSFVVETAQGRVRALGTHFIVRQDEQRSRVAVMEGAVEIRPTDNASASLVVQAGRQTTFSINRIDAIEAIDPQVDGWSRGILYAKDMRLDDFVAELGRYRPGLLRCDPSVADLRISGAFQLRDTDPVLRSLPNALPVEVLYRTAYWVTIVRAKPLV